MMMVTGTTVAMAAVKRRNGGSMASKIAPAEEEGRALDVEAEEESEGGSKGHATPADDKAAGRCI